MNTLAVLLSDFYKQDHQRQYDPNITKIVSYYVPRKTRIDDFQQIVFFGLQAFIKEYLIDYFNDHFFNLPLEKVLDEYRKVINKTMPGRCHEEKIIALHKLGYLPIAIKALPEGVCVPIGIPLIEISNTHPDFAWCTNFIETLMLSELWYTMCVATAARKYRLIANSYFLKTSDISPKNAISEFGFRSLPGVNAAIKASNAFLLSFQKSSNIPAIQYAGDMYNTDYEEVGSGMASTEHSVMCSSALIDQDETPSIKRLLTEVYPTGNFSMVCDSFDYWNVVTNILPSLKEEILKRDGTLFVRGDSGNPVDIIVKTVECLWEIFGGTTNSKGYKVLDSHVRAIYGDSITQKRTQQIYHRLMDLGFSSENVALGAGGFSMLAYENEFGNMHMFTRDTFNVAIKCSYVEYNGEPVMVYKDPKTDTGMKKSHKGCCMVICNLDGTFECIDNLVFEDTHITVNNLHYVFKDGKLLKEVSLTDVRQNLWKGKF